jgi:hypothetical protein
MEGPDVSAQCKNFASSLHTKTVTPVTDSSAVAEHNFMCLPLQLCGDHRTDGCIPNLVCRVAFLAVF